MRLLLVLLMLSAVAHGRPRDRAILDRSEARTALSALEDALETLEAAVEETKSPAARAALAAVRARAEALERLVDEASSVPWRREKRAERPRPVTGAELGAIENSLRAAPLAEDKLRVLRSAARGHRFTTAQARRLAKHFTFGRSRVKALALLHDRLVDPESFHTLYDLLDHAADRRALEAKTSD